MSESSWVTVMRVRDKKKKIHSLHYHHLPHRFSTRDRNYDERTGSSEVSDDQKEIIIIIMSERDPVPFPFLLSRRGNRIWHYYYSLSSDTQVLIIKTDREGRWWEPKEKRSDDIILELFSNLFLPLQSDRRSGAVRLTMETGISTLTNIFYQF